MNLWGKGDKIDKVTVKAVSKQYQIGETAVSVSFNEAQFGIIDGKELLLDEYAYNNQIRSILEAIKKMDKTKYCPMPSAITVTMGKIDKSNNNVAGIKSENADTNTGNTELIEVTEPRWKMADVYLLDEVRQQIDTALLLENNKVRLFDEWKLSSDSRKRALILNFYGASGTGKSMTGEAIAGELGRKVYRVNYAQLESKYVGETPKNIKKVFELARRENAVIIFDEADSFLGKRLTNVSQSADYGVNITRSVMLIELENFDGIVIFTTNLIKNYDEAFKRRILASIKFELPDEIGREKLFRRYVSKEMPLSDDVTTEILAKNFEKLSGADIKDMTLYAALNAIKLNPENTIISMKNFQEAYKIIRQRYDEGEREYKVEHETISQEQYEQEIKALEKQEQNNHV